jgi:hypothetical protein
VKVRVIVRGGEGERKGEGKEKDAEEGRLKGQGREREGKWKGREGKGKGKGREREGKGKGKGREREGKGKGKGRETEGRRKGKGREREGKGKGKGREREGKRKGNGSETEGKRKGKEREGKGKVKGIALISAVSVRFETVLKYRNKPKKVIIFFRKKYRNKTETVSVSVCFGSNRKKKNPFHRTPYSQVKLCPYSEEEPAIWFRLIRAILILSNIYWKISWV